MVLRALLVTGKSARLQDLHDRFAVVVEEGLGRFHRHRRTRHANVLGGLVQCRLPRHEANPGLGLFDEVIGTEPGRNLKGRTKLEAIKEMAQGDPDALKIGLETLKKVKQTQALHERDSSKLRDL